MRQVAAKDSEPTRAAPLTFEQLYEQYGRFVRLLLMQLLGPNRGDCDDLTQEVFLVVLERFPQLRIDAPGGLLYQIAVRVATNARRRERFRRWLFSRHDARDCDRRTPEVLTGAREEAERIYAALDRLSEKKRLVFVLFELQGLSGQEISEALDIPLRTVHTRLFYARSEFLAAYEELSGRDS